MTVTLEQVTEKTFPPKVPMFTRNLFTKARNKMTTKKPAVIKGKTQVKVTPVKQSWSFTAQLKRSMTNLIIKAKAYGWESDQGSDASSAKSLKDMESAEKKLYDLVHFELAELKKKNDALTNACQRLIGSLSIMITDPDSCDDIVFARKAVEGTAPAEVVYSLAIGDVVRPRDHLIKEEAAYRKDPNAWEKKNRKADRRPWIPSPNEKGEKWIITATSKDTHEEYGINGNAWFDLKDWEFVKRATPESFEQVVMIYEAEEMGEED